MKYTDIKYSFKFVSPAMRLLLILFCFLSTGRISAQGVREDSVTVEGYYTYGTGIFTFLVIDSNKNLDPVWLSIHPDYQLNDSIWDLLRHQAPYEQPYIQVKGILKSGARYGKLGVAEKEVVVTKLVRFDTENKLTDFLVENSFDPDEVHYLSNENFNYDTVFLLTNDHMFVGKCKAKIALKYGIKIEQSSVPRHIPSQIYWDSINRHNLEVQQRYGDKLPVGWETTIKSEVENCFYTTCDSDSMNKYNKYRQLLMVPGSDTLLPPILCFLDNSILHMLNEYPFMHIQIDSRALPGEEDFSLLRAEKIKAYLISRGIRPARLSIKDFKSDSPIHNNPMDDSNCGIWFMVTQY